MWITSYCCYVSLSNSVIMCVCADCVVSSLNWGEKESRGNMWRGRMITDFILRLFCPDVTLLCYIRAVTEAERCACVCLCMWVLYVCAPMMVNLVVIYSGEVLQIILFIISYLCVHGFVKDRSKCCLLCQEWDCVCFSAGLNCLCSEIIVDK